MTTTLNLQPGDRLCNKLSGFSGTVVGPRSDNQTGWRIKWDSGYAWNWTPESINQFLTRQSIEVGCRVRTNDGTKTGKVICLSHPNGLNVQFSKDDWLIWHSVESVVRIAEPALVADELPHVLQNKVNRLEGELKSMTDNCIHLEKQINKSSEYIIHNVAGEPSMSEGAVECAIRIMTNWRNKLFENDNIISRQQTAIEQAAKIFRHDNPGRLPLYSVEEWLKANDPDNEPKFERGDLVYWGSMGALPARIVTMNVTESCHEVVLLGGPCNGEFRYWPVNSMRHVK